MAERLTARMRKSILSGLGGWTEVAGRDAITKTFSFKDGVLTNLAAIQPGDGMRFGPRHLDFHPTQPWVYVSVESQNKLHVYKLDSATGISRSISLLQPPFAAFTCRASPRN